MFSAIKDWLGRISIISWCCLAFVLPFSTALSLFFTFVATSTSAFLITKNSLAKILRHPIFLSAIVLFAWLALTVFWSTAPREEILEGISKYRKLLIPFFVALPFIALNRDPNSLLRSFVYGNIVVAVIASAAWGGMFGDQGLNLGFFNIGGSGEPIVGRNRITQGAFYIFATLLIYSIILADRKKEKLHYALMTLLAVLALVALSGRTGYLVFIVAVMSLTLIRIYSRDYSHAFLILLFPGLLFAVAVLSSNHMSMRLAQVPSELLSDQVGGVSARLHWYRVGLDIFLNNPVFGSGIASYAQEYSESSLQLPQYHDARIQPHSELVLQAVQGGFVGLLLYLSLIWTSLRTGYRQDMKSGVYSVVLICFYSGAAINSYIWDLAEGHFLALFLGYLIAKEINRTSLVEGK
jgi:O-antigen ligase